MTDARGDSEGWKVVTVKPVHNEDTHYSGKHEIKNLRPQMRYIARVSSRNDYGFNEPIEFEFGTKGAGVSMNDVVILDLATFIWIGDTTPFVMLLQVFLDYILHRNSPIWW